MSGRILITGGAGFVGANTAIHLARQGYKVTALDNLVRRGSELNLPRLEAAGVAFRHGDVRNPEDFPSGGLFDAVLVCAAQPSAIDGYDNPAYDFSNNTFSLLPALEYCRLHGSKLILWATNKVFSASAINGRPMQEYPTRWEALPVDESFPLDGGDRSLYGCSKIMADLMVQEWSDSFNFPAFVNRFSCLAGPWQWGKTAQGWVAWWVIAAHFDLPLRYYGFAGKQVRDVLFIRDLVELVQREIEDRRPGCQVYNVGGGPDNAISLIEMTQMVQDFTGRKITLLEEGDQRRADFAHYVSDITKVTTEMPWAPLVDLEDGMAEIYRWVVDNEATIARLYGVK